MDLIHKFLNIVSPIVTTILFIFVLPVIYVSRLLRSCSASSYPKELAGKVVLITGASSGIGENLAYEYAKHGACLALVARREDLLVAVAEKAKELGSPDAIVIKADVSKLEDCKRFVNETISHFGKLDCLINNAGIATYGLFEDKDQGAGGIKECVATMDINFWGSVNATHFALPHLRKTKGRIIVVNSCAGWLNAPRMNIYNASKAAQQSFFETLRIELGSDIGITIVTLGVVKTAMANDDDLIKTNLEWMPMKSVEGCVKAIADGARRGDEYVVEPKWIDTVILWVMLLPELSNLGRRIMMTTGQETKLQKLISKNNCSFQSHNVKQR
uniref:11-beta-hydroxysteroid dehydrogenase-like 4A n=1 Tax=Erigeron canadensis TaxID=72917 RepID=UPI001CB9625B|nr:11-beta-hydroxysteroid dehydrogenase-like 4A [Erigeron canadensis]